MPKQMLFSKLEKTRTMTWDQKEMARCSCIKAVGNNDSQYDLASVTHEQQHPHSSFGATAMDRFTSYLCRES